MTADVVALPLAELRQRTSEEWREYPEGVLPLFVAETDFALAPEITKALERAVRVGHTGYIASRTPLATAYSAFAERRYGWAPDPAGMRSTADVSMGTVEILRRTIARGERVIVNPPVHSTTTLRALAEIPAAHGALKCARAGHPTLEAEA